VRAGARAFQINTGQGCHLDAGMVARAVSQLNPPPGAIVAIENVGNLVCPALFDLGEAVRIAVISTTEGADKPLKYPHMFRRSDLVLINKLDLLEHVDFSLAECTAHIRQVNPRARVLAVSARRGDGLRVFYDWLEQALRAVAAGEDAVSIGSVPKERCASAEHRGTAQGRRGALPDPRRADPRGHLHGRAR